MHPFLSRPTRLVAYLTSWLGLALLASFAVSYPDGSFLTSAAYSVPISLTFAFVSLSSWSVCKSFPLKDTHPLRISISVIASSIVGGWLFQGVAILWVWLLNDPMPALGDVLPGGALIAFAAGFVLYLLSIMFHYLLIAFESSRRAERRSLEAEILARSAELKALRAQIDPHFLFNSLNSIAALIATDAGRARTMTIQLADFFRSSVAAGRKPLIPLSEELDLVGTYLAIEQVRYGERLDVSIERPDNTRRISVPPLLLQPLVENAIKHGIAQLVDGGTISITPQRIGDLLIITIRNPVDGSGSARKTTGTAFGLQAVRDRLKAMSGGKAYLDTRTGKDGFEATVTLPTNLE